MAIEAGVPLARLTTIGTGGPAAAFARPGSVTELEEAIAWAAERGLGVRTVGLGSNVLAADGGVDALVLRLTDDLAAVVAHAHRGNKFDGNRHRGALPLGPRPAGAAAEQQAERKDGEQAAASGNAGSGPGRQGLRGHAPTLASRTTRGIVLSYHVAAARAC